ncbi:LacI family transcriptional regulator [Rhodovulum bhavnagarense]|uniref:LacI family transcriptional regulator n=1 Tax=Rhodovulum bhavnagarense TaxID=992286 RepID=A0A4R2RJA4_9RHOB|nr:LacI family DNA-binding transcriptional regulator [Rhodovulum bhavnagarense]TCP59751.1 LacI family transcriptional regulator [Rhodovulum bhavnagarense]
MNLKELAQLLGLSQTTVSRALNGYPEVAETTRARVEAAAREHGYRPNIRARGLATGRAMAVAQVIPADCLGLLANPILSETLAGATEVLAEAGYETTLSPMPDKAVETAYRDLAARGAVDGVLFHLPRVCEPHIDALKTTRLPFVVQGHPLTVDADHCWVGISGVEAARQATRIILRRGHRRIALINGPDGLAFSAERLRGYRMVVQRRSLDDDPDLIRHSAPSEAAGYAAAAALLDGKAPPTAILAATLPQALGAARACRDRGMAPGQDIALAAHDDVLQMMGGAEAAPLFIGTRAPLRAAGRTAAEMLLRRIAAPEATNESHRIPLELRGPAPAPPAGATVCRDT